MNSNNNKFKLILDFIELVKEKSEWDIDQLCSLLKINQDDFDYVINTLSEMYISNDFDLFLDIEVDNEKVKIRNQYSKGEDFFLFIGSLYKRKNINNLLLAFDIYKKNNLKLKNKLVIVGKKKWWDQKTENTYNNMSFKNDVIFGSFFWQTITPC